MICTCKAYCIWTQHDGVLFFKSLITLFHFGIEVGTHHKITLIIQVHTKQDSCGIYIEHFKHTCAMSALYVSYDS